MEDTAKVSQSVDQLVSETSGLREILRDSKMRGAWGEQQQALAEHAAALSERAKELGDRDYGGWVPGSPDFVLMYVPTDPMLDVAMDADGDVWQNAWHRHRVLIATPGLLIAFLRTVALAWQRQDIARNAEKVADLGNELYSRLARYVEHVDKMGRGLRSAVDAYNGSVGSFGHMVLPQARRFRELGSVSSNDELNEPNLVEPDVRTVNAPELGPGED
ncbi:DNA recombination protein RmuC [Candidatus Poriferisodalis sp.]|uniref:DNA recombination protein RmuC n=1 Tax=Candidatus Poriferisodalis sp. TaxID=3101277 RepID=UPI003B5193B4